MTTVSELVAEIADLMNERPETVNAYARALIDAGMLPKSRGRAVAHVDVVDVVRLVSAVALEPKIKDAASIVEDYLTLEPEGVPASAPAKLRTTAEQKLVELVSLILEGNDPNDPEKYEFFRLSEIMYVRNWREIEIKVGLGKDHDTGVMRYKGRETISGYWDGYIKRATIISGQLFAMLAVKIETHKDGGN